MSTRKHIVTVLNSVAETSMPYNEFVLYRHHHIPADDRQTVIVCAKSVPDSIKIPEGLRVYCVGNNGQRIRAIMRQIENECKTEGRKLIVHLHQPRSAAVFNLSTLMNNYRRNTIFTVHNMFIAYSRKNKVASVASAMSAAKMTFVSEAAFEYYPAWTKKLKRDNMEVLLNGVDLKRIDRVTSSADEEKDHDLKSLIYVARMIPVKNHKFLIDVLSQLNSCKLILIGSEDKEGEIKKLVAAKGLSDRVEMTGLIPRDEVFKRLKQADIYVSPSLVEGLPVSVLEAMYAGLPVISSDIQPHLEIGNKSDSVATIRLEKQEWVDKLNQYLAMDDESLRKIGIDCQRCAQDHFSLEGMLERYDKLYERL